MPGAVPYSVTKHAAAGSAECAAATCAHQGLTVHCACPQGVRTQMLADSESTGEIMLADAVSSLRWKPPLDRLRCRMANWAIAPE